MKKVLSTVLVVVMLMAMATGACFASTETIPAHINVPATSIDFSVTEKINMTATANSATLTVDSLAVTNNSAMGVLSIDSVEATAANGWTLVADTTDFANLSANAKQFSLVADTAKDMSTGKYQAAGTVAPGMTDTTSFTGKTGMVTAALNDVKVADVVVTISYVTVS